MRFWYFAVSLFAIFVLTVALVSCGGSPSTKNNQTALGGGGAAPALGGGSAGGGSTSSSGGGSTSGGGSGSGGSSSGSGSSTGSGSTPSGTVIANIEDNNWLTCGACGNTGATGGVAQYSYTLGIASPSEDGSSAEFSIAASQAYNNAYFYQQHPVVHNQFASLTYQFDLYIPNGSENAPQAIEFESQQQLNGWIYNFAWQADYATNTWRIFNYGAKIWDATGIPLQRFSPGTWHHIVAEYHNDATTHSVFHDALTIDGVRTPVNIRHDAFFSGSGDQFTNAIQMDSNNVPSPYSIYVDKMQLTYQ